MFTGASTIPPECTGVLKYVDLLPVRSPSSASESQALRTRAPGCIPQPADPAADLAGPSILAGELPKGRPPSGLTSSSLKLSKTCSGSSPQSSHAYRSEAMALTQNVRLRPSRPEVPASQTGDRRPSRAVVNSWPVASQGGGTPARRPAQVRPGAAQVLLMSAKHAPGGQVSQRVLHRQVLSPGCPALVLPRQRPEASARSLTISAVMTRCIGWPPQCTRHGFWTSPPYPAEALAPRHKITAARDGTATAGAMLRGQQGVGRSQGPPAPVSLIDLVVRAQGIAHGWDSRTVGRIARPRCVTLTTGTRASRRQAQIAPDGQRVHFSQTGLQPAT